MRTKHPCVWGIVAGMVVVYAYHHFVSPLPGAKSGG